MKNIFYLILSFFLIVEWGCSFEEEQADGLRPDANSKVQNMEVIASFENGELPIRQASPKAIGFLP